MTNRRRHISPPSLQNVDLNLTLRTQANPKEERSAKHVESDMAVEAEDALENPPPTEEGKKTDNPMPWDLGLDPREKIK